MSSNHARMTTAVLATAFAAAILPGPTFAEEGASIGVGGRVNTGEQRLGVGTKRDASPGVGFGADATNSEPNLRDQTRGANSGSANFGGGRRGVRAGAGVETRGSGADRGFYRH